MKKAVIPGALLLFLIITFHHSFSQTTERHWEEGELTWNDFQGEAFLSSPHTSELNTQFGYSTAKKKLNDTTLYTFETRNYITPEISWVKEEYKSEELLRYNQVLFNIMELHRRRLQRTLHRIDNLYMAEEKYRTIFSAANYEVKRFQNDTDFGTDLSALEYWDNRIRKELNATPYEVVPELKDRKFGYGINAGFGSGIFTSNLGEHFTPTFNFIFGFEFAYKNTLLFLNGTLAGNRVKREFIENELAWSEDFKTHVAIIDVSLGQMILDNAKHKLTPFAGFGILEFTAANSAEEFDIYRMVNYGLIYGVNYDFKFRKTVRLTPPPAFGTFREKFESSIRVKLYVTSGRFEDMKGASINLAAGYALFGRVIDIE